MIGGKRRRWLAQDMSMRESRATMEENAIAGREEAGSEGAAKLGDGGGDALDPGEAPGAVEEPGAGEEPNSGDSAGVADGAGLTLIPTAKKNKKHALGHRNASKFQKQQQERKHALEH
jgi:hypothetical protein